MITPMRYKILVSGDPPNKTSYLYLCKTDHYLAEVMHARLIRTQTEALGGDHCDYWYVGDESPALARYKDLEQI